MHPKCPVCTAELGPGEVLLHQDARLRVLRVAEPGFPAFCRVIWHEHVREMSDLSAADAAHLMQTAIAVERAMRQALTESGLPPIKMNLASLGNAVAHLHWHVVARYEADSHFPKSVWAAAERARNAALEADLAQALPALGSAVHQALATNPRPA